MLSVLWTARSSNTKTGDVPTAWVGATRAETRASCAGCPLLASGDKAGGCYAHSGQPATAIASVWRAADKDPERYTLPRALERRHKGARMVRLSALGDIGRIGVDAARGVVATVKGAGLSVVGYTHHWREAPVSEAWRGHLMASCDTLADVDRALTEGWRATVVVRADTPRVTTTPEGARVVVCPAQEAERTGRKALTCNACRLCDASRPGPVIAFLAHGSTAGRLPV